jgi:hypothetical protein
MRLEIDILFPGCEEAIDNAQERIEAVICEAVRIELERILPGSVVTYGVDMEDDE